MARPYKNEMNELDQTVAAILNADNRALKADVKSGWANPLLAVGSGGSLSAAFGLSKLHRHFTGQFAIATTPYEVAFEHLSQSSRAWLFSAGGRNIDIRNAAKWLQSRDHRHVSLLTTESTSPLVKELRDHASASTHVVKMPGGKDGFLATNSLLGFVLTMARAYSEIASGPTSLLANQVTAAMADTGWRLRFSEKTKLHWERPVTIVLHGVSTATGAIDLESKFTEAALGPCQIADFRNFAHGRHHWLAKRDGETAVIALVGPQDRKAADATLAALPPTIPVARFDFDGEFATCCIESLLAAFFLSGAAGEARNIDPGQPGVPEFGRKIYSLKVASPKPSKTDEDIRLISQKVGQRVHSLKGDGSTTEWRDRLAAFRQKLEQTNFKGLVLDFDGTIVETRARFEPPTKLISERLTWIAQHGVLGIATGRGQSARHDLQAVIPPSLWTSIHVGYYNGSVISTLDDDTLPERSTTAGPDLAEAAKILRQDPWLQQNASFEERTSQIIVTAGLGVDPHLVWRRVCAIGLGLSGTCIKAYQSGHSIDVVAASTSKTTLYNRLRDITGGAILAIGDRGAWPGNDTELLQTPYALTVDECSKAPETCWPVAPRGLRGTDALEWILSHLRHDGAGFRIVFGEAA